MTIVRPAERGDRDAVLAMVAEYLDEMRAFGSEVLSTPRTFKAYGRVFDEAVSGANTAAVIVDVDARLGLSIGFWAPQLFETRWGRAAQSLGDYVRPAARRQGLGRQLREALRHELAARGFKTLLLGVLHGNEAGLQAQLTEGVDFYLSAGAIPLVVGEV